MPDNKFISANINEEEGIAWLTLNRPEKKNAINRQMHLELQAVCRSLADDFETRVVILSGEGGFFSSGADTSEWRDAGSSNELEVRHTSGIGSRTSAAIEGLDQITIAAVQGFAVGGAVVLTACCDLRVAGESAWFSIPEVELGLPLGWNALPRLAREIGHARALELTITCERFSSAKAYEYGLVTHLTSDDEVEAKAREQKMVTVNASEMASAIAGTGKVHRHDGLHAARPGCEHHDAVGQRDGFSQIVGHEEHGLARAFPDRQQLLFH